MKRISFLSALKIFMVLYNKSAFELNIWNILRLSLAPSHVTVKTVRPNQVRCFIACLISERISTLFVLAAENWT